MYYIYHIPTVKIGCTDRLEARLYEQGYSLSDCEILETHTDIYVASKIEKELQKKYGYKVDIAPYYVSKNNSYKAGQISSKLPRTDKQYEAMATARKIGSKLGADSRREQLRKPISVYKKDKTYVGTYSSQKECALKLNLNQNCISDFFQGKAKSVGGYILKREIK
jgi:hypothetical protein